MSCLGELCLLFLAALTIGLVESRDGVMTKKELTVAVTDIKDQLANLKTCDCDIINSEAKAASDALAKLTTDFRTARNELTAIKANADEVPKVNTTLDAIKVELAALTQTTERNSRSVGFYARQLKVPQPLKPGATLALDTITNVGGAYDDVTGMFKAPFSGTYFFYAITGVADNSAVKDYMTVSIVLNGQEFASCAASYGSHFETAVCQGVVKMVAGQTVFLQNAFQNSIFRQFYTSFGGHLIQADV